MPVTRVRIGAADADEHANLAGELADELKANRAAGQPLVIEQEFVRTGLIGVKVVWDKFAVVKPLDRAGVIRRAYELARSADECARIAFVSGYTTPEAFEAELLPASLRLTPDPNTNPDQLSAYHAAMIEMGASKLFDPINPQLRFQNIDQAKACRDEMLRLFPGTDQFWTPLTRVNNPGVKLVWSTE